MSSFVARFGFRLDRQGAAIHIRIVLAVEARESLNTEDQAERLKALRGVEATYQRPAKVPRLSTRRTTGSWVDHAPNGRQPDGSQVMFTTVPQADGSQAMVTTVPQVLVVSSPGAKGMQYAVPQMMSPSNIQPMPQQMAMQFEGQGSGEDMSGYIGGPHSLGMSGKVAGTPCRASEFPGGRFYASRKS